VESRNIRDEWHAVTVIDDGVGLAVVDLDPGSLENLIAVVEYYDVGSDSVTIDCTLEDPAMDGRVDLRAEDQLGNYIDHTIVISSHTHIPDPGAPVRNARIVGVVPNPFNPQTSIEFELQRPEYLEIAVYRLNGHRVSVLTARTFTAGLHSLTWNGCDSQGRAMSSGTYIVRLESDTGVEARKLMLVR
jgi:hypothetical protein